jgi:tungstate transport system substrate-binding protein
MRMKSHVLAALVAVAGVSATAAAQKKNNTVILATTTSTQDSGLLDVLVPEFEKQSGYVLKTISVGSGQAMAMGRKGEADVLLVHSPADEKKMVEERFAVNRRLVMHNDFVIVGPPADPAKIKAARRRRMPSPRSPPRAA